LFLSAGKQANVNSFLFLALQLVGLKRILTIYVAISSLEVGWSELLAAVINEVLLKLGSLKACFPDAVLSSGKCC